jgi:hypothetical protein
MVSNCYCFSALETMVAFYDPGRIRGLLSGVTISPRRILRPPRTLEGGVRSSIRITSSSRRELSLTGSGCPGVARFSLMAPRPLSRREVRWPSEQAWTTKASRAPIAITDTSCCDAIAYRVQCSSRRGASCIDSRQVASRQSRPRHERGPCTWRSAVVCTDGDDSAPIGARTPAGNDDSFRSSVERETPRARAALRLQPSICDSTSRM